MVAAKAPTLTQRVTELEKLVVAQAWCIAEQGEILKALLGAEVVARTRPELEARLRPQIEAMLSGRPVG